jgi:hypothetical protein
MFRFGVCFSSLLLTYLVTFSQPDQEAYYRIKKTNLAISLTNSGLGIQEQFSSEKVFVSNFDKYSSESIHFSDMNPLVELKAETLTPTNKNSYKKTRAETIDTQDMMDPGIFYGGYKISEFIYPNISIGSIGKLEYVKELKDPHLISPFYFDENISVQFSEFSVSMPENVILKYQVFGDLKDKIRFVEQKYNGQTKYIWSLANIPPYEKMKDSPSHAYHGTHVIVFIDSYTLKGEKVKVSGDVNDLFNWYSSLINKIPNRGNYSELHRVEDELLASLTTNKEKAKAIFNWVQKNIKYIAFEDGMAGFIPREPADVFNKRYGDCKDMANLLRYMMNRAGIESYLAWIGTRRRPYSYALIPTPIADDHMICAVKNGNDYLFLDATNSYITYGKPSSMIQGKEALIGLGKDQFKVIPVPVRVASENQRIDTCSIEIEKNGIRGKFVSYLSGYKKDDFEIQYLKGQLNIEKEYMRDFFEIGDNNIQITNVVIKGLGNSNDPAIVTFDFIQAGYYKAAANKIYINLNLNKIPPGETVEESRSQWLEADYHFQHLSTTLLTLPTGYQLDLPTGNSSAFKELAFETTFSTSGTILALHRKIESNYLYLTNAQFSQWNKFIQALAASNRQLVTLYTTKE